MKYTESQNIVLEVVLDLIFQKTYFKIIVVKRNNDIVKIERYENLFQLQNAK